MTKAGTSIRDNTATATHTVLTYLAELMHHGAAPRIAPVTDDNMPCKRRHISQNAVMITHYAVMRDMHINHQQVIAANAGNPLSCTVPRWRVQLSRITLRSPITNSVGSPLYFVLAGLADTGKLEDLIITTNAGGSLDDDMAMHHRARPDFHILADIAPGSDSHIRCYLRSWFNNRLRMNIHLKISLTVRISATQTSSPSTLAWHSNFQMPRLLVMSLCFQLQPVREPLGAEACIVSPRQIVSKPSDGFLPVVINLICPQSNTHGLDNQNTRHNRVIGECPLKKMAR